MGTLSTYLLILFIISVFSGTVFSASCPDSSTLPPAPILPSSSLSSSLLPSGPITQNHWSETANYAQYRPPKVSLSASPSTSSCPHKENNLKNWHDEDTWLGSGVPVNNANVNIPVNTSVLLSACSLSPGIRFGTITIPVSSRLIFNDAPIDLHANGMNVYGSLLIGSETCRLRNKVNITLYGRRNAQTLPAAPHVKGIHVQGTIDVHGALYYPTWTRLATTAKINDTWIFVQDLVNWQPGQRIAITTTELKDARDWHRNEERTIVAVRRTSLGDNVAAIQVDSALDYVHYGGKEYQAEVALLSRNIVIQGDENSLPTDTQNATCIDSQKSSYPCENSYLTGFGAHVVVNGSAASGRFSGVELFRVGQTNVLGRYPIHFHLIGNITSSNYKRAFIQDSSVHDSYFRCYAVHGTSGVRLSQNTAYNAIGHCFFLEDGVEEENVFEYNQAAYVHPLGPFWNPSLNQYGDSWGGQYLQWYPDSPKMILPSDMSAGCFYITNTYNTFVGNAASGGWAGFSIPSLRLPVKLFNNYTTLSPANRPFATPFRGNTAHSSGYWWRTAGSIYVGGELQEAANGTLFYNAGRSRTRDTCSDPAIGSLAPGKTGGCGMTSRMWLRFEDNKVFLSNRGMQNWGTRAEIINFELHDVSLAMNVFGRIWIDNMLMECRTVHRPTFFNGCPNAPPETPGRSVPSGRCNVRDTTFFSTFGGFQWYDVGQQHILTNSVFRNCREDWDRCVYGSAPGICRDIAVFTSLTHSDEFVPEQMQISSGIKYENVSDLWKFSTKLTSSTGVTVSGRLQNWLDADGSASGHLGRTGKTVIGSAWANEWWKYNEDCVLYKEAYSCKLAPGDAAASMKITSYNINEENKIGETVCMNGGGVYPCPVVARASHFGSTNESTGLEVGVNARMTGPIIRSSGGWFIRFLAGTPANMYIQQAQLSANDTLILAIPYPANTRFSIYNRGANWCDTRYQECRHNFTQVSNISAVVQSFGDAYYWDNAARILYIRIVTVNPTFGAKGKDPLTWEPYLPYENFTRHGHTLYSPSQGGLVINATCSTNPCAQQNDVKVPAALNLPSPPSEPTVGPTPGPTTGSNNDEDSGATLMMVPSYVVVIFSALVALLLKL